MVRLSSPSRYATNCTTPCCLLFKGQKLPYLYFYILQCFYQKVKPIVPGQQHLIVRLSKKLDKEVGRGTPEKRPHRQVLGAAVMNRKLLFKVGQGEESVAGIETLLVFSMTALNFSTVSERYRGGLACDVCQAQRRFSRKRSVYLVSCWKSGL